MKFELFAYEKESFKEVFDDLLGDDAVQDGVGSDEELDAELGRHFTALVPPYRIIIVGRGCYPTP